MVLSTRGLMFGSVLWGVVAERFGIPAALLLSAGGLAAASVVTLRWRLPGDDSLDLRPSLHWPVPVVAGTLPGDRGTGAGHRRIHRRAREPRRIHRGACGQRPHSPPRRRDLLAITSSTTADPRRHLEVFVVESWLEHMRQHERVTRSDLAIECRSQEIPHRTRPGRWVSAFQSARTLRSE